MPDSLEHGSVGWNLADQQGAAPLTPPHTGAFGLSGDTVRESRFSRTFDREAGGTCGGQRPTNLLASDRQTVSM
jgi:hypothetical protein